MSLNFFPQNVGGDSLWETVCWSAEKNKFVSVAAGGTNRVMNSTDGVTWTEIPQATSGAPANGWRAVCWAKEANIFVAVANSGTNRVMTSEDGITWTARSLPDPTHQWFDVCWSPQLSRFVAVAEWTTTNNKRVMTSSDGISWTSQTTTSHNWVSVCWSPQLTRFVAVAYAFSNPTNDRVMTSSDGFTWTLQPGTQTNGWTQVCWSPLRSLFVAVADSGAYRIMTSSDGFTWTGSSQATTAEFRGVCWSQEAQLFVGVCWNGATKVWTSSDGFNWTGSIPPEDNAWYDVCWSKERNMFAVTSRGGSANKVMISYGTATTFIGKTLIIGSTASAARSWSRVLDFNNNSIDTYVFSTGGGSGLHRLAHRQAGGGETIYDVNSSLLSVYYIYVLSFVSNVQLKFNIYRYDSPSTITTINSGFFTSTTPNTFLSRLTHLWLGKSAYVADSYYNGTYSKVSLYNGDLFALSNANVLSTLLTVVSSTQTNIINNSTTYTFRSLGTNFLGVVVNIVNVTAGGSTVTDSAITLNGTNSTTGGYLNIVGTEPIVLTVPTAPSIGTATAGNAEATVTWGEPTNGGSDIISYTITSTPQSLTKTVTGATTVTTVFYNLTNGTSYTFKVFATNAIGNSPQSGSSNSVTPIGAPSAPTGVSATAGNTNVTVTWTGATSNGSTISGYRIESSQDQSTWTAVTALSGDTSKSVSGLTNGTPYYFRIYTTSNAGDSVASSTVNATPYTNPSVPRDISAIASNARVDLSWNVPATIGGSAISSYNVTSPSGGTVGTVNLTTRTVTITNLANGTSYTFYVTATNAQGATSSSGSVTATPYTNPSAPRDISAIASNARVDLSWNVPATIGGSAISSYSVTRSNTGAPVPVTVYSGTTRTASATVLTNGTLYTFNVTATNAEGATSSAGSVTATPFTVPDAPRNFTAVAGIRLVDLSWSPPLFNGGRDISGYLIQRSNINNYTWGSNISTNASVNTFQVTGLGNNTRYYFRIYAINIAGLTLVPSLADTTTFNFPGQPTNLNVTPTSNGVVRLTWTPPLDNGGSPITSYSITNNYSEGTVTFITDVSATVSGLTNKSYDFSLAAITAVGNSPTPATYNGVIPFTSPSAPTIGTPIAGNAEVTVNWTSATSNGSTIDGYRIEISGNISTWTTVYTVTSGETSKLVTGLTNGTTYYFRVITLSNNAGNSPASSTVNAIPNITPNAPTNLIATPGNTRADLSWNAPVSNGGTAITSYNVISSPTDETVTIAITIDFTARTAEVTNLTNGTLYTFWVTATNDAGSSGLSNNVQVRPFTAPGVPTNVTATTRNAEATINWTAPTSDGGTAITSYTVTSSTGNFQATTANGLTTTATISGLTNGTAYTFTVLATNDVGPSTASGASNPVTPNGPPLTNKKIAISNDGKVVALSSSSYSDISKGRIYVYELSYNQAPSTWNQLGLSSEIIVGLSNDDQFGWDLALSSDGRVVAGSSIASDESGINNGQVRLFELSNNTNRWLQKGFAINGQTLAGESGYSISLAGNGNRIAIGAWKDSSNGTNAGAVRVYDFSASVNDWRQQGQTIAGDSGSYEGYATALSLDGQTLASGCLNVNNANNVINAGQVKTFTWSGTAWIDKGIIQGPDISYLYFGRAIKLSANGNTIVIGAPAPGNNLLNIGRAYVYGFQGGTTWTQLGQTIQGISGGDEFGSSVSMSNDGTIIAVGSDNNSSNRGQVRIFAYANNYWTQISNAIDGKTASSRAGIHALSGDGTTLIQSNNSYSSVYGINKTLAVNAPMTSISGNLLVLGNISVNSLDISTNHSYSSNGYSYKMFGSDLNTAIMKEYYSNVSSNRHLKVQITGNGYITNRNNSYRALSDSRLKENIQDSGPKLEDLLKVRVVDYTMKGSNNTKYIGVLAQELEDVFPNLVTELEPSPKDIQDGNTIKYKAVNYSSFDAILIKSLQEQNAMLKNIEKRIIALEDELDDNSGF